MLCNCHFIPKHLEDKINSKTPLSNISPKNSQISSELRSQRRNLTNLNVVNTKREDTVYTKNNVYTAKNRQHLPGTFSAASINDASSSKDSDVICAWIFSDYFVRFCRDVLNRNSYDNKNAIIKSTVHYYVRYNNAFFNGTQMVYGDGDQIVFHDFAQDPTVVFHELWHGVTDCTCGLEYKEQSGALNESLSDVFASIILQWMNSETVDEASWLIGERCVVDIDQIAYALRSMVDPGTAYVDHPYMGTDDQPQDMTHYYDGSDDNRGVHINSGIPNHAFYLFAKSIGGYSWDIPCKIWYKTITTDGLLSPSATFAEFAQATITTAIELYASDKPDIVDKLRTAWQTVKVI